MSRIKQYIATSGVFLVLLFSGCTDYLEHTPAAETSETNVFGTYVDFQAFQDQMYELIVDYLNFGLTSSFNLSDEVYRVDNFSGVARFAVGDYWYVWNANSISNFFGGSSNKGDNLWKSSWKGIRIANMCLENMDLLVQASSEEKELIKGQAYFFRAFFHWDMIRYWGGLPYVTQVFDPTDDMRLTQPGTNRRPTFQETVEMLVADLDSAAVYLPEDWDNTTPGGNISNASQSGMRGRATKGAAMALKAKALLYAASPLMNKETTGQAVYDIDLCKAAAEAAAGVIELANKGVYGLIPFDQYKTNFVTVNVQGQALWNKEWIWGKTRPWRVNRDAMWNTLGALHSNSRWNDKDDNMEAPTQNFVDLYEMASGLPIDDPESGYDPMNPWANRDPRFYQTILTDGTVWASNGTKIETHLNGLDYGNRGSHTGYMCQKYWVKNRNIKFDRNQAGYAILPPIMRLPDIYLVYAEAVNEAYGPNTAPVFDGGKTGITAVEAINIIRRRVGSAEFGQLADVNPKFTASKELFRERIRNERAIELCFEGHRFDDLRRWYVARELKYRRLEGLEFDKEHTYFNRVHLIDKVFEEKHYWLPLNRNDVTLYEGFNQNPGW